MCALQADSPRFGLSGTLIQNSLSDYMRGLEWANPDGDVSWQDDVNCDNLQSVLNAVSDKGAEIRLAPRTVVLHAEQPAERRFMDALVAAGVNGWKELQRCTVMPPSKESLEKVRANSSAKPKLPKPVCMPAAVREHWRECKDAISAQRGALAGPPPRLVVRHAFGLGP